MGAEGMQHTSPAALRALVSAGTVQSTQRGSNPLWQEMVVWERFGAANGQETDMFPAYMVCSLLSRTINGRRLSYLCVFHHASSVPASLPREGHLLTKCMDCLPCGKLPRPPLEHFLPVHLTQAVAVLVYINE